MEKIAILDYDNARVIVRTLTDAQKAMSDEEAKQSILDELGLSENECEWMCGFISLDIE